VRQAVSAAVLVVIAALAAAGCGTGGLSTESGDQTHGRELFVKGQAGKPSCGSCHTLADAGTRGTIGPNLDDAFGVARSDRPGQGFKESTIREVVLGQIKFPAERDPGATDPVMPANLVRGQDAVDVATYVAAVAGKPRSGKQGGKITAKDGKSIFSAAGCTGCHTLADAGSTGTVGPNLDEAKPPRSLVVERVTNGKGAMPSFKGQLTDEQIQAVADYVSRATKSG
jgi:mono/diheme cytochrome c family protein